MANVAQRNVKVRERLISGESVENTGEGYGQDITPYPSDVHTTGDSGDAARAQSIAVRRLFEGVVRLFHELVANRYFWHAIPR